MKNRYGIEIPERRWTAFVKFLDGTQITTTVYGSNVSQAEKQYKAEHPGVDYVAVHSEQMN